MGYCPNCKAKITCGCQRRKAKDGASTCSNCVTTYNNNLKIATKSSTSSTAPTNVQAKATIKKQ